MRSHAPKDMKERKLITHVTRSGVYAQQAKLFLELEKEHKVRKDAEGKYYSLDPMKYNVEYFGDFPYLLGNTTHKNNKNKVVRCHYNYMTPTWAKGIDGVTTCSDEKWKELFIANKELFNKHDETWYHIITEDMSMYDHVRAIDFHGDFEVLEGACECCCSEIQRVPFEKNEVEHIVNNHLGHMHFIIKSTKCNWKTISTALKLHTSCRIVVSAPGGAKGPLDKARLLHYIARRESSVGLACHLFLRKNVLDRFFVYTQRFSDIVDELTVGTIDKDFIRLNCKQCIKRSKKNLPCWRHVNM